jgi:superfamily II DNA or RNA helicase
MYRFLTEIEVPIKKTPRGVDWPSLVKDLSNHTDRNNYLYQMIAMNAGRKILVLTWNQSHAKQMYRDLQNQGVKVAIMIGAMESYEDSDVLVGTFGKIGTGFDEEAACPDFGGVRIDLLFLMGTTKSQILGPQSLGRSFRSDEPEIVVFVDNNGVSKSHWNELKKWALDQDNVKLFDWKLDGTIKPCITRTKKLSNGETTKEEVKEIVDYQSKRNKETDDMVDEYLRSEGLLK